ncbi:unnamed protein product [Darwinula stevensoni]|uniref:Mediator of RNA polymerase II transcription subunit 17 n=1 Tax=Darwinula stevensoni TaxID=69355 RepID=A0A7R8XHR6_9CRUS|nr:unnamed protein product [Darwinula stevensoni]CAG0892759.1 unnamed protein product [Darwinula stevensoni]
MTGKRFINLKNYDHPLIITFPLHRAALSEASVLLDVIEISREKKYMVLDPVSQDPPDPKPIVQLIVRKKALSAAATILLNGAERLRVSQNEMARSRGVPNFHIELLKLRQNWRLKKVGNSILGDLSYRTAGSRYWQSGVFEVSKNEEEADSVGANKPVPALKVTVPSELECIKYIQVTIQKADQETLCSAKLNISSGGGTWPPPQTHWQQRLEVAQTVLFCKELFARLAREAVCINTPIPPLVVGNQITVSLFPGVQLIIGLCHSQSAEGKRGTSTASTPLATQTKLDHNHVLEHSLHQLLREVHYRNMHHPMPHPTTALMGLSKRRRVAGPDAYSRGTLLEMSKSETLLEQIIKQAQHIVLRLKTMYVIDTLAREIKDPLIVAHWNALNSPTQSCVKINITSHGYETLSRTSLVVHVGEKTLKTICRDGRVMNLSYEPQELRDLILCQIAQHQITAVQSLARCMGWAVVSSSFNLGVSSPIQPLGHSNVASCILASPSGERRIAIQRWPLLAYQQVAVQMDTKKGEFGDDSLVKDPKWEHLSGSFKEVRWEKMEGRNYLNKMELLMASLTPYQNSLNETGHLKGKKIQHLPARTRIGATGDPERKQSIQARSLTLYSHACKTTKATESTSRQQVSCKSIHRTRARRSPKWRGPWPHNRLHPRSDTLGPSLFK